MLPLHPLKFKDGLQSNGAIVIRDGTKTLCRDCHKEFNTTPTKDPTQCHIRCQPCYFKGLNKIPDPPSHNFKKPPSDPKSTSALEAEIIPDPLKSNTKLSYWSCTFGNKLTTYLYTVLLVYNSLIT